MSSLVEKTIMTGSHRSAGVRALAMFALIASIWIAGARSAQAQTRIMPLGDSITGSRGCWRAWLWNDLQSAGFTSLDLVGTLPPQGCGIPYDGDNEGHGGILATDIASQNLLPGWLAATRPDIVMMHLGTNDVWSARSPDVIFAAFSTLVVRRPARRHGRVQSDLGRRREHGDGHRVESAPPGRTDLTITGSAGGLSRTALLAVAVSAAGGGGAGPATAAPVIAASGPWFNEEQVRIASTQPLTALALTITVETTGGVTFNGQYNTAGSLVQTHSSTASAITYQYTLGATRSAPARCDPPEPAGSSRRSRAAAERRTPRAETPTPRRTPPAEPASP
jgi:hypothetical protein